VVARHAGSDTTDDPTAIALATEEWARFTEALPPSGQLRMRELETAFVIEGLVDRTVDRAVIATATFEKISPDRWLADRPFESGDTGIAVATPDSIVVREPAISGGPCVDDTWRAAAVSKVPRPRSKHAAVWTGSQMIVWGGNIGTGSEPKAGRYDPTTDSWSSMSLVGASIDRSAPAFVWTGSKLIVWGGGSGLDTGGIYDPVSDTWTATATVNAPTPRYGTWAFGPGRG